MSGERIGRVVARLAMNTLAVMVALTLARVSFIVGVGIVAIVVPLFFAIELAVALAKIEPPRRRDCGRVNGLLAAAIAAPMLVAVTVIQCREREPDRISVARAALPTPNAYAAMVRLADLYQ